MVIRTELLDTFLDRTYGTPQIIRCFTVDCGYIESFHAMICLYHCSLMMQIKDDGSLTRDMSMSRRNLLALLAAVSYITVVQPENANSSILGMNLSYPTNTDLVWSPK